MRKVQVIGVISLVLLLFVNTYAEGEEKKAKTKLEEFYYKTGALIITKSKNIGRIKEGYYYQLTEGKPEKGTIVYCQVKAVQVIDKTSDKEAFGVTLGITQGWEFHQVFIDYDEIPSLIEGVEFLLNDAKKPEEQQVTGTIEYRSKGGLFIRAKSISWWFVKNQELETLLQTLGRSELLGIQVAVPSIMFEDTSSIEELKNLFVKAKEHLDAMK